jgi:hypothetical protein
MRKWAKVGFRFIILLLAFSERTHSASKINFSEPVGLVGKEYSGIAPTEWQLRRKDFTLDYAEFSNGLPISSGFGQSCLAYHSRSAKQFMTCADLTVVNIADSHPLMQVFIRANRGRLVYAPVPASALCLATQGRTSSATGPISAGATSPAISVQLLDRASQRGMTVTSTSGAIAGAPTAPLVGKACATSEHVGNDSGSPASGTEFNADVVAPSIRFPASEARLNDTSTLVSGHSVPGAAVHIKEGAITRGTGSAESTGLFQISVDLTSGPHTLTAVAEVSGGNLSRPSAPTTFTNILPSPITPLAGVNGRIQIDAIRDFPRLVIPSLGHVNTVRIEGALFGGNNGDKNIGDRCNNGDRPCPSGEVHLRREITQATTGLVVASSEVLAQVAPATGFVQPSTNFSVSSGWDGQMAVGGFASAGPYVSKLTVWVSDRPIGIPASGTLPPLLPPCGPAMHPVNGPCTFDKIVLLTTFGVLEHVPPLLPPTGGSSLPKFVDCAGASPVDSLTCSLVQQCASGSGGGICVPRTTSICSGATCGYVPDGCGGVVNCGSCP